MGGVSTELWLRVNGIQPAFGLEFGLDSPRSNRGRGGDPYRQANVSYSLLQRREGRVVRHTLIDCGMGVVPSLLELEQAHGVSVVHEVLLTHSHWDHFVGLDWLSMCLVRNGRAEQPRPLPIYATAACWADGPNRVFPHLAERTDFRPLQLPAARVGWALPTGPADEGGSKLVGNAHPTAAGGGPPALVLGDLTITPFAVDHGPKAPGAVGLIARHGGRKVIFTGDFLHVPDEDNPLLRNADVVFCDANTWHPTADGWHQSVLGNRRLLEKWRPRRAYMTHYSGYEDRRRPDDPTGGPMDPERLAAELRRLDPGGTLRAARHGMILGHDEPWPVNHD